MPIKSVKLREARNRPTAAFVWFTREMLESDAWCSLRLPARRVIDRLCIEHMAHGGTENGQLVVTYRDFRRFGLHGGQIGPGIKQAVATGFVIITEKGKPSTGADRWPTKYALGWLPLKDGSAAPNRWKAWRPKGPITRNIDSAPDSRCRETRANPSPCTGNQVRPLHPKSGPGKHANPPIATPESGCREIKHPGSA
jgi:hypothetical protein